MRISSRASLKVFALAVTISASLGFAYSANPGVVDRPWIGTWATAPQPFLPGALQSYRNQTLRLIVHTSVGGKKVRIKISNTYGDKPLLISAAHIARRTSSADIDPASDRALTFQKNPSVTIATDALAVSDPVELEVPALSDLAISIFLPQPTEAKTIHALAKQTSYVSTETGDATAATKFPVGKSIHTWPFLTGVDVEASPSSFSIVAFGSSLTDGDGTTTDTNGRWPDVLAERLQKDASRRVEIGVLNEGIIGNRLLNDSPKATNNPFGAALGKRLPMIPSLRTPISTLRLASFCKRSARTSGQRPLVSVVVPSPSVSEEPKATMEKELGEASTSTPVRNGHV